MNEHNLCCGTVADKQKLCAEIAERDRRITNLELCEDARARVAGRTLKFAMERGYNPASGENELEYIMRRFDEMADENSELDRVIAAQQRRIGELLQELDCAHKQMDNLSDIESALDDLVSLCNNSCFLSTTNEVIHAEATLERLYKSRQRAQEPKQCH